MQNAVLRLKQLGQMPSSDNDVQGEIIIEYQELLEKIHTPVTMEEVSVLIDIFPKTELFGLEWSLLHVFETVLNSSTYDEIEYKKILSKCPSEEWKETLKERFKNS